MDSIKLLDSDITTLDVDVVVNPANAALSGGGGVDGAIHRASGPELLAACRELGRCSPGSAVITPGFRMKSKWIIHAVGPVWSGGGKGEAELLRSCYQVSVKLAEEKVALSIAFPAISCGAYRCPLQQAAEVAIKTIAEEVSVIKQVYLCCVDRKTYRAYDRVLSGT